MKILMLSWEYPPRIVGGIARVVYYLAQKLGQQGNEVHIITCREKNQREEELDNNVYVHRVSIYDINAANFIDWVHHMNYSFLERSIKLLNEVKCIDVIHAHDWLTAFAARVLKYSWQIPLVSTIHATEAGRNNGIHNDMQRYISSVEWWLTYESWRVIVNSRYMLNEVKNLFGLPEDKIRVVPNGIDLNKFDRYSVDSEFRKKYAKNGEKIIFFVGRIVNEKGINILLDAFPKVLKHYSNIKVIIAGKGPELECLKEMAQAMSIAHKICFTGYISDDELGRIYKCADIGVFPSLYEPFGIVALECMAANVPVIVSDTGGLKEIVEHGVDGLKFYTGDSNSLADCILQVLCNPQKTQIMRNTALEKVKKIYNWETIAKQTYDIYDEIVN